MEEIYLLTEAAMEHGQPKVPVHVFPFRMSFDNMTKYQHNAWIGFWRNLKEGYDLFEQNRVPPEVTVNNKRYVFKENDR